jgi:hypothetical protein
MYYFSVNVDNETTLCIAPLSDRHLAASGQEIADVSGYFLCEMRKSSSPDDVRIIAQLLSEEDAVRLSEMLHMT